MKKIDSKDEFMEKKLDYLTKIALFNNHQKKRKKLSNSMKEKFRKSIDESLLKKGIKEQKIVFEKVFKDTEKIFSKIEKKKKEVEKSNNEKGNSLKLQKDQEKIEDIKEKKEKEILKKDNNKIIYRKGFVFDEEREILEKKLKYKNEEVINLKIAMNSMKKNFYENVKALEEKLENLSQKEGKKEKENISEKNFEKENFFSKSMNEKNEKMKKLEEIIEILKEKEKNYEKIIKNMEENLIKKDKKIQNKENKEKDLEEIRENNIFIENFENLKKMDDFDQQIFQYKQTIQRQSKKLFDFEKQKTQLLREWEKEKMTLEAKIDILNSLVNDKNIEISNLKKKYENLLKNNIQSFKISKNES